MPESQQLRDIFHQIREDIFTSNEWRREHAKLLLRIAIALETIVSEIENSQVDVS